MRKVTIHLGLLLLLCLGTGVATYWACTDRPAVEAIIRVARLQGAGVHDETALGYDIYQETQAALITSNFVITGALRDNEVNQLPFIASQADPVDWIASKLQVMRGEKSELIGLRLQIPFGQRGNTQQWELLLDKILDSYLQEIVSKERLDSVAVLTKLRKRYATVFDGVTRKQDEILELEKQLGAGPQVAWLREHAMQRIERLDAKLLELELQQQRTEVLNDENAQVESRVLAAQIKFVTEERDSELERADQYGGGNSGDVEARKLDLASLRNEMATLRQEMQVLEASIDGPDRVTVIQPATATSIDYNDMRHIAAAD